MNISNEAVEAAARTFYGAAWGDCSTEDLEYALGQMRETLEAAAPHLMAAATSLIRDLTDPEECSFDHHGGCQAHGYLSLKPGETCPQADAKAWAAGAGE